MESALGRGGEKGDERGGRIRLVGSGVCFITLKSSSGLLGLGSNAVGMHMKPWDGLPWTGGWGGNRGLERLQETGKQRGIEKQGDFGCFLGWWI